MASARFTSINNRVNTVQQRYKEAVQINNQYNTLIKQRDDLTEKYNMLVAYIGCLKDIEETTKEMYSQFQGTRMKFIETHLKTNIDFLFPLKGFTPSINYNVSRRKIKSKLELIDKDSFKRTPQITEGGMLKQLIGYTSAMSILQLAGSELFFMDEAFSNASATSKDRMQSVLFKYVYEDGLQTILITQSPECYKDLPRKEFYLELDEQGKYASLADTKVFDLNYSREDLIESIDNQDSFASVIEDMKGDGSFE